MPKTLSLWCFRLVEISYFKYSNSMTCRLLCTLRKVLRLQFAKSARLREIFLPHFAVVYLSAPNHLKFCAWVPIYAYSPNLMSILCLPHVSSVQHVKFSVGWHSGRSWETEQQAACQSQNYAHYAPQIILQCRICSERSTTQAKLNSVQIINDLC